MAMTAKRGLAREDRSAVALSESHVCKPFTHMVRVTALEAQAHQGRGLHKRVRGITNLQQPGEQSCKVSCYSEQQRRDHG